MGHMPSPASLSLRQPDGETPCIPGNRKRKLFGVMVKGRPCTSDSFDRTFVGIAAPPTFLRSRFFYPEGG